MIFNSLFRRASMLSIVVLMVSGVILAQNPAQLVMAYETTKKGKRVDDQSGTMEYVCADGKYGFVIDFDENSLMQLIIDTDAKKMTSVVTEKGKATATVLPMLKFGSSKMVKGFLGEITATDEIKDILGYEARKFIISEKDGTTEAWVANVTGFSWSDFMSAASGQGKMAMMAALPELEDYPNAVALESVTSRKGGKEVTYAKATLMAVGGEANVDALEIPADAEVNDMSAMLKGLGG